jgi:uncharacterized RDD family membrane protein YckC
MQWYYAVGDQRNGPVSDAEFGQLVQNGTIRSDTLVWREGMSSWQPYSTLLTPAAEVPPVPLPVPLDQGAEPTEVCAVSGKRYPRREMLQYEGKWIAAEHRETYFQRMREGVAAPGVFVYGGFWLRFVAKFIDGIILYVAGMPGHMLAALVAYGSPNFFTPNLKTVGMQKYLLFTSISTPLGILLGIVYAWFFISRFDATPGKMALGMKLVRPDGSRLSTGRIIGRLFAEWISTVILFIGYIMVAFDSEKRALHDRICDTRVIKVK